MGNIVTLQDGWYNYELPKAPSREEDLLFYNLPKHEQYWRIPPRLDFRTASQFEKIEFINLERDRWLNGIWFWNNGEPTWITGMHYDHMVNMTFEFGRARYYDQHRLDFYMRDLVRKDEQSYGCAWYKPRRYGMTAQELTNSIYVGMEDFKQFVGLMSNEGTKAVTTLMRPIIDSIIGRPAYMRPGFYKPSGRKPRKSMEFTDGQIDFDEEGMIEEFACLGGYIMPYNTTTAAMEGHKKHYIVMDEVWKWVRASPKQTLGINKKCIEDFGISGKISMLSTMGDSDDYKQAIKEGIEVGDESNPEVRDGNGRTTSGLYRYFVGAEHSKVLPASFTNKHGYVNVDQALTFIHNDRAKLDPHSKEYIFEIRRMPLTYEEATSTADVTAIFPNSRLRKRLEELRAMPYYKRPYVRGWLDEGSDGKVVFRPDPKGIWKIAIHPYKDPYTGQDYSNRFRTEGGRIKPPRNPEFCFGYDPIRYADKGADDRSASKACIIVRKKFDYYGGGNENRYAAICLWRPSSGHDGNAECRKAGKYWGMEGMHERQVESVEEDFIDWKCEDLLMRSEKDGKRGIWTDSNRRVTKNGVEMLQADMKADEDGYDPINEIPFEEILEDRMVFDPYATTEHDVTMADIMLKNGEKQMKYTNARDEQKKNHQIRSVLFPRRRAS